MSHAHHHDDPTVPRGALIGIAVLLAGTMAFTGAVSMGWLPHSANPSASRAAQNVGVAEERMLRFADQPDGTVLISDASTGEAVTVIGFGKGGFVRATMHRLAKARKAVGIGAVPPFRLVRWDNGALSLIDPETGKQAEIYGFGSDHVRAFADMLKGPKA
jgi:putative photosynthetic complex assembly protein